MYKVLFKCFSILLLKSCLYLHYSILELNCLCVTSYFMCVTMCAFRLPLCIKHLPHTVHLYGFSPVWMRMCKDLLLLLDRSLPQTSHGNPVAGSSWAEKKRKRVTNINQKSYKYNQLLEASLHCLYTHSTKYPGKRKTRTCHDKEGFQISTSRNMNK